ncbi:DEAD/DEAH box helicase [Aureispira anguillae]|uniref:DEAD/DEAH box helicase n=1 Tax=Aureispira anguillae TaxID=2864201 RepID=A0A916DUL7_9BACT|nr:DEAD/DEAH box helicase [Aureispira anguillae]BDS12640.1 DEAD/DEAH box helicase [Aureispira anguillae]
MSTFEELGLNPNVLKALGDLGFEQPTKVQEQAIPFVLGSDRDLVALAQTGTGKTAAFSLPIIHKLDKNEKAIQALVLCPTRELCIQISKDIASYTKYEKGIQTVSVYGGAPIDGQIRLLRKGCHIVVGTPGRVRDLIERRKLDIREIKFLVLDEADEMLTMGFKDELDAILASAPEEKQGLLFSATMPREIDAIAANYMRDPEKIEVSSRNSANLDVKHVYCVARSSDRYRALKRIADISPEMYGIVFCRTRAETKEVADWLMADGYSADALHGDLSQAQRDYVMGRFRKKSIQLLVATDVAARGIDVNNLTHVLHYKIPDQLENYIHRSGRTGRAGNKGTSIALLTSKETHKVRLLEKKIGQKFERRLIPTGEQVCEKRLFSLINKIATTEVDEGIEKYLPTVYEQLEALSKEEILQKFVSLEFQRFLNYYKNAGDLNVTGKEGKRREDRKRRDRSNSNLARFYINVGSKHKITTPKMIGLINDSLRVKGVEIGKIEIMKGFSFFEIDKTYETKLMNGFRTGMQVTGVNVVVERTADRTKGRRDSRGNGNSRFKRGKDKSREGRPREGRDRDRSGKRGKSFKPKKKRY